MSPVCSSCISAGGASLGPVIADVNFWATPVTQGMSAKFPTLKLAFVPV